MTGCDHPRAPLASDNDPAPVTAAERLHARITDPIGRTLALTSLIRGRQEQLELVALLLSRQRVDQLARIVRRGGPGRRG